jgi:hypothetical protein
MLILFVFSLFGWGHHETFLGLYQHVPIFRHQAPDQGNRVSHD